jgi:hypothetical protein
MTGPAQPKNCSHRLVAPTSAGRSGFAASDANGSWFRRAMAQAARVGKAAAARGVTESLA